MKYFAREVAGKVAEIIKVKAGDDIAALYHPDVVSTLVEVGSSAKEGWVRDGDGFAAPAPVEISKDLLLGHARARRFALEVAGTTLGDMPLRTDRETRSALTEAATMIAGNPDWSTRWELPNGVRVTVDAVLLPQIIRAVGQWRADAFAIYDAVADQIEAGTISSFAEINAAFAS